MAQLGAMPGRNLGAAWLIVESVEEGALPHIFDRLRRRRSTGKPMMVFADMHKVSSRVRLKLDFPRTLKPVPERRLRRDELSMTQTAADQFPKGNARLSQTLAAEVGRSYSYSAERLLYR